jgi:hypothetical protein
MTNLEMAAAPPVDPTIVPPMASIEPPPAPQPADPTPAEKQADPSPNDLFFSGLAPAEGDSNPQETSSHLFSEEEDKAILRAAEIFEGEHFAEDAKLVVGALSELSAKEITDRKNALFQDLLEKNRKVKAGRWG